MNGIRLYDQPLRLKERNSSGNTGSTVEAMPSPSPMGPPRMMPPFAAPPSLMMRPANSTAFSHDVSSGHAGLLRSASEPEGLGTNWHENRRTGVMGHARERAAGPYARPHVHQRPSHGVIAQNIASQLHMLKRADSAAHPHRHHNYHQQFGAHSVFHRW